jgi:hypothetical protein
LVDDLNLNACDFIQLDLEGYEFSALQGARKTIEKYKPLLCIEVGEPDLKTSDTGWGRRYGISIEKLEDLIISDFGYEFVGHHKDLGGVASWDKIYKYSDEVTFKKIGETDIE